MRTALGLDLDLEALQLCLENNINKVGADEYSRISLFHGNVLNPCEAILVGFKPQELRRNIQLEESDYNSKIAATEPNMLEGSTASKNEESIKADAKIPARDIICAFDYSCCCLHKRAELVLCFKHVLEALSKKGGLSFQFNNLPSNSITWQLKCPGGRCQRLETGFQSVQFWLREMPDMKENRSTEGFRIG
ncbi:Detected protein of confused Function [Hibiscus syriacus]|uniref:Detected protein of confused Function n=1 Tax=Hibiscus syriacus TaxID=106335 RepID=A0A6A2YSQ2_HIBSY|nr:Detected protein of confused Function [Hibiscus syriacus]